MKKTLELDLEKVNITEDGITDYYWPVSIDDVKQIRTYVRNQISEEVKSIRKQDADASALLEIGLLGISNLWMDMLHATLLYTRSQYDNVTLNTTPHYHFLNVLLKNENAPMPGLIGLLKMGPAPLSKIKLPLRFMRDLIKGFQEGIPRRRLFGIDWKNDVVTLSAHGLVRAWKKSQNKKATFLRANYWFKPVKKIDVRLSENDEKMIHRLLALIEKSFSNFQLALPEIVRSYFEKFIRDLFLYSKHHLESVRRMKNVPMNFWGHTGGNVWMRILSVVVRERGGKVTGFDHAGGSVYCKDLGDYHLKELLVCDNFITFSKKQAEHMAEDCLQYSDLYRSLPKIFFVNDHALKISQNKTDSVNSRAQLKTIMIVSTIYPAERVGTNFHFMSDISMLDWEVRLALFLKKLGYKVILKPHPECPIQTPKSVESFGIKIQQGRFDEVISDIDLIVFSTLASTTFYESIVAEKPILFVDFSLNELKDEAEKLLSDRCSIVKGGFSNENKPIVDWNSLEKCVEEAVHKSDTAFQYQYYNC